MNALLLLTAVVSAQSVTPFVPATQQRYECTIHTLQMKGSDGKSYNVVMDLIRYDANPNWGIGEDRQALRVGISDASSGAVVASKFVDLPKADFQSQVGTLRYLNGLGIMSFTSVRGAFGLLKDGDFDFTFNVLFRSSGALQQGSGLIGFALQQYLSQLSPAEQTAAKDQSRFQLLVTDYPQTQHSGVLLVKFPGKLLPTVLTATLTPSTVSHHYGNALTEYVFLASVPTANQPQFIAVVTKAGLNTDLTQVGAERHIPVGYLLYTDASGKSTPSLLFPDVGPGKATGEFRVGAPFLGTSINVRPQSKFGSVTLNDGTLPTRTYIGSAQLAPSVLLSKLGINHATPFNAVVIDVTGKYIVESGVP